MNIHEHQAKKILNNFGVPILNGVVIFNTKEIEKKVANFKTPNFMIKAQIHAGGRGKAGGIKMAKDLDDLKVKAKDMLGKVLINKQTGTSGRKVKRLYIEETCEIVKEFYLSCLVDRASSKIAFLSSAEGGMDIEEVAKTKPEKITTVKIGLSQSVREDELKKIIYPFALNPNLEKDAFQIIQAIYKTLIEKDANLIEINPLSPELL